MPTPSFSTQPDTPEQLLRLRDVLDLTALSRATLYREIEHGDFPQPIKFGTAARWPVSDVARYIEERKYARRSPPSAHSGLSGRAGE